MRNILLVAVLAVAVVVGGTTIATGSPTAHVSISKKGVKKLIRKALRNKRGPAGPQGPAGLPGAPGTPGAPGAPGAAANNVVQHYAEYDLTEDSARHYADCAEGQVPLSAGYVAYEENPEYDPNDPDSVQFLPADDLEVSVVDTGVDDIAPYALVWARDTDTADATYLGVTANCVAGTFEYAATATAQRKNRALARRGR